MASLKKDFRISENIRNNIASIRSNFEKTKHLFLKKRKRREMDTWLFNCETLPKFGKEFWFMHFVSTDKDSKGQLILTFGQSEGKVNVNKMTIDPRDKKPNVASVCWAYLDKKMEILNSATTFTKSPGRFILKNNEAEISFNGNYPKYSLCIKSKGKLIADLDTSGIKTKQKRYEFTENFKGVFGYELVNLYLDFKGVLDNKKIKGRAIVQKVLITGPFVPWRWGRFTFRDGSTLEFYKLYVGAKNLNYRVISTYRFSGIKSGEHSVFQNLIVDQIPNMPFWSVQSPDKKIMMILEIYSTEKFTLKARGNIDYTEHLVRIVYFQLERNGKIISLDDLGGGIGMFEVTKGYMI
jgi:hypothetical protein